MDDICWPSIQNILNLEGENIARYVLGHLEGSGIALGVAMLDDGGKR